MGYVPKNRCLMYLCFHRLCHKFREFVFLTLLNALHYLFLYQTFLAAVMMQMVWKKPSSAALPERNILPSLKSAAAGLEL